MAKFGQSLARTRKRLGMTQRALAARVKKGDGTPISPQYLNDIEHDRREGAPPDYIVRQIAKALGIELEVLAYWAGRLPSSVIDPRADPAQIVRAFRAFRKQIKRP